MRENMLLCAEVTTFTVFCPGKLPRFLSSDATHILYHIYKKKKKKKKSNFQKNFCNLAYPRLRIDSFDNLYMLLTSFMCEKKYFNWTS